MNEGVLLSIWPRGVTCRRGMVTGVGGRGHLGVVVGRKGSRGEGGGGRGRGRGVVDVMGSRSDGRR